MDFPIRGQRMADEKDNFNIRIIDEISGIRGDIRELMATVRHFNEKMDRAREDVNELKAEVREYAKTATEAHNMSMENEKDIQELKDRMRTNEKEQKAHRKWIFAQSIPVIGMVITIILALFT